MATSTAATIAGILKANAALIAKEGVEINAALMQNEERRKYPSIDVQNVTGEETLKGYPSKTVGQTFLVHLFYRYRSFGEQHEPNIKEFEDLIFDTLDDDALFDVPGEKLSVTQSWRRESETFPVHRSHSILTVTTEKVESTDGSGVPGDTITIKIPTGGTELTVISLVTDEKSLNKQMDLTESADRIFTKISNTDLLVIEVQLSKTQEDTIAALVHAGKDTTATLGKNGTPIALNVNLTSMVSSATRSTVQTTLITMDVKN